MEGKTFDTSTTRVQMTANLEWTTPARLRAYTKSRSEAVNIEYR